MKLVLLAWGLLSAVWLIAAILRVFRNARAFRLLAAQCPPAPARWPRLSIVIAACDEAETLREALATVLSQDYPDLEIILVDDRSRDDTGKIIDELATSDPRIVPLHVRELPAGWLGKNHAMHQAESRATGEWLLFTDADVHFVPGALLRAVALCVAEKRDHLTVVPDSPAGIGFPVLAALTGYVYQLFWRVPIARIERTGRNAFFGLGAFNLVRTATLRRSEGLAWLRMEVSDDFGLALLVHRAGGSSAVLGGRGQVSIVWWPTFPAMLRSKDKDFSDYAFSQKKILGWAAALPGLVLGPLAFVGAGYPAAAAILYVLIAATGVKITRLTGYSPLAAFLFPCAAAVVSCNLAHAGWAAWRRRGLVWRGTSYSLDELRSLQRVRY